jgi:hypothetical protein
VLSFIDFITISRTSGDCVVLLVENPGLNQLARFFPSLVHGGHSSTSAHRHACSAIVNPFLLADTPVPSPPRPISRHGADDMSMSEDVPIPAFEFQTSDIMDLSSFLEFAFLLVHSAVG